MESSLVGRSEAEVARRLILQEANQYITNPRTAQSELTKIMLKVFMDSKLTATTLVQSVSGKDIGGSMPLCRGYQPSPSTALVFVSA